MYKRNEMTGFIGAGNMATALIKGLMESGTYKKEQLRAFDKDQGACERLARDFGVACTSSNGELVRACATVVLAVKPQNMRDVLLEIKEHIGGDSLIISIAAGIPLSMVQGIVEQDIALVRVMPNTPALVLKGASALAAGAYARPEHMALARKIFEAVGDTVEVQEALMDAVTAVSGSGPGYIFRFMECMVDAGIKVGLEPDVCLSLVVQTFLGAAQLAKESDLPLSRLREMVTSPGGTTAAGLGVLNDAGLHETFEGAVTAARDRAVELGKNY